MHHYVISYHTSYDIIVVHYHWLTNTGANLPSRHRKLRQSYRRAQPVALVMVERDWFCQKLVTEDGDDNTIPELENSGLGLQLTWQSTHPACLNAECNSQNSTNQGISLKSQNYGDGGREIRSSRCSLSTDRSNLGNIVQPGKSMDIPKEHIFQV